MMLEVISQNLRRYGYKTEYDGPFTHQSCSNAFYELAS